MNTNLAIRGVSPDVRDIIQAARGRGWSVCERTGSGNLKLERPNPGGLPSVLVVGPHATGHALKNAESQLFRMERESGWAYCERHSVMYVSSEHECPRCKKQPPFNQPRILQAVKPTSTPSPVTAVAPPTTPPPQITPPSKAKRRQTSPGRRCSFSEFQVLLEEGLKTGRWKGRGKLTPLHKLFRDAGFGDYHPNRYLHKWRLRTWVAGDVWDAFERLIFEDIKSHKVAGSRARKPILPSTTSPAPKAEVPLASAPKLAQQDDVFTNEELGLVVRLVGEYVTSHPTDALLGAAIISKVSRHHGK